jgi:aerobic-type carbon monoxide dehydrogenase small subunit (CoxS/CutS family)
VWSSGPGLGIDRDGSHAEYVTVREEALGRPKEVSMISLSVNGKKYQVDVSPDTPLLWVIREKIGLTGTKFGCGMSLCGACTVHVNGEAVRSCVTPVSDVEGKKITTIEGIGATRSGKAIQDAWIAVDVPQCGYCQSGQIMAAAALLRENPKPSDADIDEAMSDIICRCGTYQRIRKAIHQASKVMATGGKK